MKSNKTVRKALWMSVLSIALCLTMLVGTTFAWFTDTASTAVNKIQAGNLKIGLEYATEWNEDGSVKTWTDAKGGKLNFVKAAGHTNEAILWEPGCTYKLPELRVINQGNLAVKCKVQVNFPTGEGAKLMEVLDWEIDDKAIDVQEFALNEEGDAKTFTISAHMQESAGNDYQKLSLENISITVLATQAEYEYDSFDKTYDANAEYPVYPAGVTDETFENAQGAYNDGAGHITNNYPAVAAYVDDEGQVQYVADLRTAALNGATEVFCKKDADMKARVKDTNRTEPLTGDLTIHGNGANFAGGQINISHATTATDTVNVTIENAVGLSVWGSPSNTGKTYNVTMKDCHLEKDSGEGLLMWRGDSNCTDKINLVIENCYLKSTGTAEMAGVHTTAAGTITIKDSTFVDVQCPININFKQSGEMTATVENCVFTNCGHENPSNDYFAPVRFVNGGAGTLTANIRNNTFTGTIGTNGDILLGDYRETGKSNPFTVNLTTEKPVQVKKSVEAPVSMSTGSIAVEKY